MVFSSAPFLFAFLPAILALYFLVPRQGRNLVLLAGSLLFYTWGGGAMVLLLLVSTAADYVFGAMAAKAVAEGNARNRRWAVVGSVSVNLALLCAFKYANFVAAQLTHLGFANLDWQPIPLPIGISFFTFQSMSYTLDAARGQVAAERSLPHFALYVSLFPQLIAGPIVRYREIAERLQKRTVQLEDVSQGALRFCHGLVKKVVVADAVGSIADAAFALPPHDLTASSAWLGVWAYTLQIYFDFSGYSDMAIGLGRMFGFQFPENFLRPYSAVSITDFWRRWHVTLSRWFRDYLYLPLGGSRGSSLRTHFNLALVFVLCGLWHGANWTFVLWGVYHGVLLVVERMSGARGLDATRALPLRRAVTLALVVLGWVIFRADSLTHATDLYRAMFSFEAGLVGDAAAMATHRSLWVLWVASAVVLLPRDFSGAAWLVSGRPLAWAPRLALLLVLLPYAILLVASGSYSPFLYFQF